MPTPDHEAAPISRRTFLSGSTAAAAALAAASLPLPALARAGAEPGPNVRVSNDGYPLHVEPSVAANPRDQRNLLGAAMVGPVEDPNLIATYASFDGGSTWRSNGPLPLPPGTAWADDVTVGFDGQGRGFVCAMATSGLSRNDRGVYIWRTDDGGRSFAAPVAAMSGQFADHPSLAVDQSRDEQPGNLYAVWSTANNTKLGFSRSTNGGRSFEPQRVIAELSGPNEAQIASPVVATAPGGGVHAIYGVWPPPDKSAPRLSEIVAHLRVVSSNDFGVTFSHPVELGMGVMEILMPGGAAISSSGPAIAALLPPPSRGRVGVGGKSSSASPHRSAIYAAFVTHQPGSDHTDLVIATSSDRGRSWSPAVPVTRGAEPVYYFQPQLEIDEDGRIGLSAFALAGGHVDVVLFVSEPHRPRFGAPIRVTDQSFDPAQGSPNGGGKHGAWWIGDYQGLASTAGAFHPFWNDTRTGQLQLFTATVRGR